MHHVLSLKYDSNQKAKETSAQLTALQHDLSHWTSTEVHFWKLRSFDKKFCFFSTVWRHSLPAQLHWGKQLGYTIPQKAHSISLSQLTPPTCEHAKNRWSWRKSRHVCLERVIHTTEHRSTVDNGVDPSCSGIILPKVCLELHKKNGDAPRKENMNTSLLNMGYLPHRKHQSRSSGIKSNHLKVLSSSQENQTCGLPKSQQDGEILKQFLRNTGNEGLP